MTMDNSTISEQLKCIFDEAIEVLHEKFINTVREEIAAVTADRMLDKEEAAAYLGIRPCTLSKWITDGTAPKYSKLGSRVLFRRQWLKEYAEQKAIDNLVVPDVQINRREGCLNGQRTKSEH